MFTLIFALIFGIGLSLFALQNTNNVTVTLANIPVTVPLWIVIISSLLVGLIFASYFNIVNIVSSKFQLHDKDKSIRGADKKIADLKSDIQNLKDENSNQSTKKDLSL